ncbi:hypothetical protein CDL15_Pgr016607 [Punica granatum]|nr:hypothetical protein CDL15_Pgr016607 [Punica granatum]
MILRRFLKDPTYTVVGFWNHSDARRLKECGFKLEMDRRPVDLRLHVETDDGESLCQASFERIVKERLGYSGVALEMEISMSDWENPYLR